MNYIIGRQSSDVNSQVIVNSGIFDINQKYVFSYNPQPWCPGACVVFTLNAAPNITTPPNYPNTKFNVSWNPTVQAQGYNITPALDGEYIDSFLAALGTINYRR